LEKALILAQKADQFVALQPENSLVNTNKETMIIFSRNITVPSVSTGE